MAVLTTIYDVESNIETTLYQSISTTATTGLILNTVLTITKGVLSFETNGRIEYLSFGSTSISGGRTTLIDVRRNLSTTLNDFSQISATGLQHVSGVTKVKLVNYHALYNLKANLTAANTFTANQSLNGTNKFFFNDSDTYIYDDGTDLKFKSTAQAEVALATLASLSGVNDKAKVSATDTTEGYLNSKLTAGDGLSKTIINPAGNESLDLDIDLADTTIFKDARTGNEARVVVTKATDGKIDPSFISTSGLNNIDAIANATLSSGDAVSFDSISRLVKADGNDLNPFGLFAGIATSAGTAGNAMTFAGSGLVTVPAFTLADRNNCRLYNGVENTTSNTTTDTIAATTQWRAQIFVPQTGQDNVSRVNLNMTNNSCTGTGVVEIYAVTGTAPNEIPTGAALGTSSNVTTWSSAVDFNFTTPIAVTPGTAYAIVFKLTSYSGGNIVWNYNNTSVYANGNSATSANSGGTWTVEPTFDRRFIVYYRGLAGEPVYLSDTAGALSLASGTYNNEIGFVLSSTQVFLAPKSKCIYGTVTGTFTASETVDTTITIGFRARKITLLANSLSTGMAGSIGISTGTITNDSCLQFGASASATVNEITAQPTLGYLRGYNGTNNYTATITLNAVNADSITIRRALSAYGGSNPTFTYYLIIE